MSIRVRFAPSPTGYLHVGGARTALFNWLYARHVAGTFLLRIEDTDKERSSDENTRVILEGLTWLGLDWDEEIVFQGAGLARHQALADQLLAEGKAYTDEGAIRFRMPTGEIAWDDAVHGRISFQGEDLKDFIILRSDRTPIYNLAVVADDLHMRITHVLRGDDHIANTPKQIALYRALGQEPPVFGHVPMINGPDGKKLSKRHGATAVGEYQHLGILPAAMRNFLALLGWSPGGDREIMDQEEMISLFSLKGIQKKSAIFDVVKLGWMNSQYIARSGSEKLLEMIEPELKAMAVPLTDRQRLLDVIDFVKPRAYVTNRLVELVATRLDRKPWGLDPAARAEVSKHPEWRIANLPAAKQALENLPSSEWQPAKLEVHLKDAAKQSGLSTKEFFQPIRIAVSGSAVSEPVNQLLSGVGQSEAIYRIGQIITSFPSVPSTSAHSDRILFLPTGGSGPAKESI